MAIGPCIKDLEKCTQFQIQKKKMKYLETYISDDKTQLYKDNFLPLVKDFKKDVRKWQDLKINLIGRINLFKMMWLSKSITENNVKSTNFVINSTLIAWNKI